jgi:hypothetical protein
VTRHRSPEEIRELARMTPRRASLQSLARAAVVVGLRALDNNRQGSASHIARNLPMEIEDNFMTVVQRACLNFILIVPRSRWNKRFHEFLLDRVQQPRLQTTAWVSSARSDSPLPAKCRLLPTRSTIAHCSCSALPAQSGALNSSRSISRISNSASTACW